MIYFVLVLFLFSLFTSISFVYLVLNSFTEFDVSLVGPIVQIAYSCIGSIVSILAIRNKLYVEKLYKTLLLGGILLSVQVLTAIFSSGNVSEVIGILVFGLFWFWVVRKVKLEIPVKVNN